LGPVRLSLLLGSAWLAVVAAAEPVAPNVAALKKLGSAEAMPFPASEIVCHVLPRGTALELPLDPVVLIYGLGLQIDTFQQQGKKRLLADNNNNAKNLKLGFGHAVFPFYVSRKGYAVLVDTARYVSMQIGTNTRVDARQATGATPVIVDVPAARGVDVYVFAGPTMRLAIQRYNLFAGGGFVPPLWGLGVKYRCQTEMDQAGALRLVHYFRDRNLPLDVVALEPGWQSHAHPCSLEWNPKTFPDPARLIADLAALRCNLNLWEHPYIYREAPLARALGARIGDFLTVGGVVPDLGDPQAREIFGRHHGEGFIDQGVVAFKLDATDNSA